MRLKGLTERTLPCYREDGRVERTLEAKLRDIEFGHNDESPTRRMPELLTQFSAKDKPAWHPTLQMPRTAASKANTTC
jgi:hypothetical protein